MTANASFLRAPFRSAFLLACALSFFATSPCSHAQDTNPGESFVRINATLQSYNFIRPWEKGAPTPRRGLGAVLEGGRVVVTAELVVNSTYIELERADTGEKTPAKIIGLDYEANLALLAPAAADSDFLNDLKALKINTDTKAGDQLHVWQIEDNGEAVATNVRVQRATVGGYFIPGSVLLTYQVKGSLQYRANSFTLPVTRDGQFVGLLLSYDSDEQVSQILPAPIITQFLTDLDDGEYNGFPNLGLSYTVTLDDQLRKFAGIDDRQGGVFVRSVKKGSTAAESGLKEGDIIMKIAGEEIDSRGFYDDPVHGKINFSHLMRGSASVGDKVKVNIVRDGKDKQLVFTLMRREAEDYLIDPYMFDRGPRFMIFGGLLFQDLTLPYLQAWGNEWKTRAPFKLVHAQAHPAQYEEDGREKLVFLSQVLRTPSTLGYEGLGALIVTKVNDLPINNIGDLSAALQKPDEKGIHKIEFTDYPKVIYLDDRVARAVNAELLQRGISQIERLK
jgi:S1-C subfamily serine protease